jgi:hypothetical protein
LRFLLQKPSFAVLEIVAAVIRPLGLSVPRSLLGLCGSRDTASGYRQCYYFWAFEGPRLTQQDVRARARMNQWISAVNSYYYTYMIYLMTHQRLLFPEPGIASDEKVVVHALPKVELGLGVVERELSHGQHYLLGSELSLADFYLLPSTSAFSLTEEGRQLYPKFPAFCRWREGMENLPATSKLRAAMERRTTKYARESGEISAAELLNWKQHEHIWSRHQYLAECALARLSY